LIRRLTGSPAWAKKSPNTTEGGDELEIRPHFTADVVGAEFTAELQEQERRLRAQVAAR
jgi:hypothetical protein